MVIKLRLAKNKIKMKILLTGSSGMVGQNILTHPLAKKFKWLTPSSSELNLLDFTMVKNYLKDNMPEMIIHAAGRVGGIQANIREPVKFLVENLEMGKNLLLAASDFRIAKLINFGSTCMYPRNKETPLNEDEILSGELEPTNEAYAIAKIAITRLASYLNKENSHLKYKTLIPCNLYGLFDNFDPNISHMIPAIIHKIHLAKVNNEKFVEIWGTGEVRREFLFAEDLADAVFRAVENFEKLPEIMNIGLGRDYTVKEYYHAAAEIIGYQGDFQYALDKPTGMQRKLSNTGRALDWGWRPRHTLKSGLEKTYQFYLGQIQ
jgi:GDP-L-fucose synthase